MNPLPPTTALPSRRSYLGIAAAMVIALGLLVRVVPWAGFGGMGFDESVYRNNVVALDRVGIVHYPWICRIYIEDQGEPGATAKLPPTRVLYIYSAWLVKRAAFANAAPADPKAPGFAHKDPALISLRTTSALFSCLFFIVGGVWAWRMLGPVKGLGVLALMATSPLQIHMAQHAFIDGFFAFWATLCLWLLWENLRRPDHWKLLVAFGLALAAMVLTKENAFFVYVGLGGLVAMNRWTRFGSVTPRLLLVMVAGPLAGLALLVNLAGGLDVLIQVYKLMVTQTESLTYAIRTGDGPWHRYLVDLMILNPLVLCLAIGGFFTSAKNSRPLLFLSAFWVFTYLMMCHVKYGINLRYATIWELPLCALATAQVSQIASAFGRRAQFVGVLIFIALCAYALRQYVIFFVDFKIYDLVSEPLLRAVNILK